MPNVHKVALELFTDEVKTFKHNGRWNEDSYEVVLTIHDQLEVLVYAVPMESVCVETYRMWLHTYKEIIGRFLQTEMPEEMKKEYRKRLRLNRLRRDP